MELPAASAAAANRPRYEMGDIVAKGAMGVIRRVRETSTNREVAMKQIRMGGDGDGGALAARFVQEAKLRRASNIRTLCRCMRSAWRQAARAFTP